jgi:hypothetical protein
MAVMAVMAFGAGVKQIVMFGVEPGCPLARLVFLLRGFPRAISGHFSELSLPSP